MTLNTTLFVTFLGLMVVVLEILRANRKNW